MDKDRAKDFTVYKASKKGTGGAIGFDLNVAKEAVFVNAANQDGEKSFDWDNKIVMKWGLSDIGSILAVLQRRVPSVELYHQAEASNTTFALNFDSETAKGQGGYYVRIARQDASTKELKKVSIGITHGEAATLAWLLQVAITRIHRW